MLWWTACRPAVLSARTVALRRFASTSAGPAAPNSGKDAASAIIEGKIGKLIEQLEVEDAYMGPITDSQRSSDVQYGDTSHVRPDLERLRIIPEAMSFYMANPALEEALRTLRTYVDVYNNLPIVPETEYERPAWINPSRLYSETKEGLSAEEAETFHSLLDRLNRIEPQLQPPHLRTLLYEMKDKSASTSVRVAGQPSVVASLLAKTLDQFGRSTTVGRRKTASARVQMARTQEGAAGQILVNGRSIEDYFPSLIQRQEVLYPLKVVEAFTKFNIFATVQGGGHTSQACSVALGIAKGLGVQNPLLIGRLLEAGCLTRDTRKKERKKPGRAKARKSYGWVKR